MVNENITYYDKGSRGAGEGSRTCDLTVHLLYQNGSEFAVCGTKSTLTNINVSKRIFKTVNSLISSFASTHSHVGIWIWGYVGGGGRERE